MIELKQNSGCTIEFLLKDKTNLKVPYFLFDISNADNTLCFSQVDNRESESPYCRFNVLVSYLKEEELKNGVINLPKGDYVLNIYEQIDPENLLLANTTALIYTDNLKIT